VRQSVATGQWISRDGQDWWFDAGSVAIDFAYVGGFGDAQESLSDTGALDEWLSARFAGIEADATDRDLTDARALQQALARLAAAASADESGAAEDIDVVNLFAATPDIPPSLAGGSRRAGRSRARVGQALSAIAREAIAVFSADNLDRVRECGAEDCHLIFYDESRSNNRRWCSMQRCGNRAKVRAHRERGARQPATR
jgi:predicted RNA-binding Zn ribbon-like protein